MSFASLGTPLIRVVSHVKEDKPKDTKRKQITQEIILFPRSVIRIHLLSGPGNSLQDDERINKRKEMKALKLKVITVPSFITLWTVIVFAWNGFVL